MTYSRVLYENEPRRHWWRDCKSFGRAGEGQLSFGASKAPSSAPSGHLLPKGRRGANRLLAVGWVCASFDPTYTAPLAAPMQGFGGTRLDRQSVQEREPVSFLLRAAQLRCLTPAEARRLDAGKLCELGHQRHDLPAKLGHRIGLAALLLPRPASAPLSLGASRHRCDVALEDAPHVSEGAPALLEHPLRAGARCLLFAGHVRGPVFHVPSGKHCSCPEAKPFGVWVSRGVRGQLRPHPFLLKAV